MAGFGAPKFGLSKFLKDIIIYDCVQQQSGLVYTFGKNGNHSNWRCTECAKHQRRNRHATIASIRVQDGVIMTDPENPSRRHSCAGPIRSCVQSEAILGQLFVCKGVWGCMGPYIRGGLYSRGLINAVLSIDKLTVCFRQSSPAVQGGTLYGQYFQS